MERPIQRLQRVSQKFALKIEKNMNQRIGLGLTLLLILFVIGWQPHWIYLIFALIIGVAVFFLLVYQTRQLKRHHAKLNDWRDFLLRQQHRKQGTHSCDFDPIALMHNNSEKTNDETAQDLHFFGSRSLYHLLDECLTQDGQVHLVQKIKTPLMSSSAIMEQQKRVKALTPYLWFFTKLRIIAGPPQAQQETISLTQELATPVVGKQFKQFALGHMVLYPLCWGLAIGHWLDFWPLNATIPLVVYFFYMIWSREQIGYSFTKAVQFSLSLQRQVPLYEYLESAASFGGRTHHPLAKELDITIPNILKIKPSAQLKKINGLVAALSVQAHPLFYLALNVVLPWNYFFSYLLENLRLRLKSQFPLFSAELKEIECLMCYLFLYSFQTKELPQLTDSPKLEFTELFHPLLPSSSRVANSFTLDQPKTLALITGSNMAGKSTFLRTVGINQQLALMGCPVFATGYTSFAAPLRSCLQISDSLEDGYSTFYFEVKQVAKMLQAAEKGESFLFLIDEIFRGTNNRERLTGSQSVIAKLLSFPNVVGFITTHDLELAQMEAQFNQLGNWHFGDEYSGNGLEFSYKIKTGPCPSTNALKIMAAEGLPVPL